ncbi:MAG: hypothetical protein U0T83_08985 [Bacteriovoracaceae bacterium]
MVKKLLVAIIMLLMLINCSKKDDQLMGAGQIVDIAKSYDPTTMQLGGFKPEEKVSCEDYGPECLLAIKLKVKDLNFDVIQFESLDVALRHAKKIDGYYYMNFVFDEVTGEPVLEKYIKEAFGAVRPLKEGEKRKFTIPVHKAHEAPPGAEGGGGGGHH